MFLTALRRGKRPQEAAREAGFSRSAFFRLRKRNPVFTKGWDDAISFSSGPRYICSGNGRRLQLRRIRSVRFTPKRKHIFLAHFAGTCNLAEAAEKAGISEATVFEHRAKDPEFSGGFNQALEQSYARLETDLLARRVKGQQYLKRIEPTGEPEPEFERALKLLMRWERRDGRLGPREVRPGSKKSWSFEEAIAALEKKLRALGISIRDDGAGAS